MPNLTVKWVQKLREGEITRIFAAQSVAIAYPDASIVFDAGPDGQPPGDFLEVLYSPSPNGIIYLGPKDACLLIDPDDERTAKRLAEGTCYVVNEQGRTIGTYRLDDVDINGGSSQKAIRSSRHHPLST